MLYVEMMDKVADAVQEFVDTLQEVVPQDIGLDRRAGYRFYVNDEILAVTKDDDRVLQYYGGFEYVDKHCRTEIAGWVFYSAEDDRVADHLSRLDEAEGQLVDDEA